jgi:hypothetical protein
MKHKEHSDGLFLRAYVLWRECPSESRSRTEICFAQFCSNWRLRHCYAGWGQALKYFFAIEVTLFVRLSNQAGNFTYNGGVRAQIIFVAYGQELIRFEYARLFFWR